MIRLVSAALVAATLLSALALGTVAAAGPAWHHGISTFYDWQSYGVGDWHDWHISKVGRHPFACGGWYYRLSLGVAHKTLPCGTKVQLRNPANGLTITVRVVDRGPFTKGVDFDQTTETCLRIRHCYTGPLDWRVVP